VDTHRIARHTSLFMLSLGTACAAALLVAGAVAGLWQRLAGGPPGEALLAAGGFTLTTLLAIIWRHRARSAAWLNALDAYAAREIARTTRRKTRQEGKRLRVVAH